jgi:ribonuclease HI
MEVFDAELWAMWIALKETTKRAKRLPEAQKVIIFSDSQAAVR